MTEQDLAEIEARAAAATPGPWAIEREELGEDFSDVEQMTAFPRSIGPIVFWEPRDTGWSDDSIRQIEADAAFIAHARTNVPVLVAEVRRQTASAAEGWSTALALAVQYGARASERAAREALRALGVGT